MIKNMTRKGLAIGATAALTLAGLVGFAAPANAAAAITVEPSKGTSYTMVSGQQLDLRVFGNVGFGTDFTNLRWEITNADEEVVTLKGPATSNPGAATRPETNATPATSDADRFEVNTNKSTATGGNQLGLSVDADVATTLQVRAFIDLNGNGTYEDSDLSANVVTVTFIKAADVVPTIVFDTPLVGDADVKATVSFNLNNEQLVVGSGSSNLNAVFSYADGTNLGNAATQEGAVAGWTAAAKFAVTHTTLNPTLVVDKALKLQMRFGTTNLGAASTILIVKPEAASFKLATVQSDSVTASSQTTADTRVDSSYTLSVAARDTGTFTAATAKPVAGAKVSVTFDVSGALSASRTVTIAGTTFTAKANLPGKTGVAAIALTTGADGSVSWPMATAGFVQTDTVKVTVKVENLTAQELTITSRDAAYTMYVLNGGTQTITPGGTASLNVAVYDQFGGLPAAGYDVRALYDAGESATRDVPAAAKKATAASNVNVALVNGRATLSITDNGVGTNAAGLVVSVYDLEVRERVAGGDYAGSAAATIADYPLQIVATARTAGAVTVSAVTGSVTNDAVRGVTTVGTVGLSTKDNGSFDGRGVLGDEPEHTPFQNITGDVRTAVSPSAAQLPIMGAPVTVSGAGLQFKATVDGKAVYTVGTMTVYTNASGEYSIDIASNRAGKHIVTITSGGASRTVEITFAAAAATAGAAVAVSVTNAVAGSTMKVVTTVTDKYGNPVNTDAGSRLVIVYDGPGFVVSGATPTTTAADGTATFNVILGVNDVVTGTVTATYRPAGSAVDDDNITTVANIGAAAAGTSRGWTRFLSATNEMKIYARDVVGAGKVQFMVNGKEIAWIRAVDATDPKLNVASDGMVRSVFVSDMLVGRNVIEIYEDGVRIARRIYTR